MTSRARRRLLSRRHGPPGRGFEPLEPRRLLAGEGLTARYFDNPDFTSASTPVARVDATVNFNWGTSSPVAGIANTTYSVRWTGAVVPAFSEVYTFTVTADDGVRLWVDNELIITNWVNQSARAVSGRIALHAGQPVAIKLEYYQNTGTASVRLEWESASLPREVIPQARLNALEPADNRGTALQETWTGVSGGKVTDLTGSAAYAGAPAYRQMITSLQSLQQDVGDTNGSRIRGSIVPSFTGTHVFSVAGNDDVQLSLSTDADPANATRIAFTSAITAPFAWTASPTQTSAPINLVQGQRYFFEVLHKEQGGFNHWAVGWTTPASSTVTVIGSDNIEPWGATTPLPATGILNGMSTGRDRILASPEMFARAKALVAQGGAFRTWYDNILARADLYLTEDLPATTAPTAAAGGTQPVLAGLEDNLTYLAGAYKLRTIVEGDEVNSQKYFDKAKAVIQRVIQWSTWDTGSQFLGAAMVSQGISLCYDWMHAKFTTAERQQIADRVYALAIKPTIDACTARNYWTQWYANWSFVCIGGVGSAALAFAPEYYRAEAETLLARGWPVLQSAMQRFAGENGGWPEGPGYMGYGTLYLIRLMSNLQTAVGTEYALSLEKGFQQLPNYMLHVSTNVGGNANATFPYLNGDWSQNGDPWFYWLAQRFNRGDVAKVVADRAASTSQVTVVANGTSTTSTRPSFQTPWSLLWYDPRGTSSTGQVVSPGAVAARTDAGFYGDAALRQWGTSGQTNYSEHVNIWRDSWSNTNAAVMFKGGYKGVDGHENLDGGTFIFDALGQRWATDLGRDSYSLPQVGGTNYGAYRKRAEGQNTLVINPTANDYLSSSDANERALNADQVYKDAPGKPAYAPVVRSLATDLESVGIVDLTNLYSKMRVASVQRGFRFDRTDDSLIIQDEITATDAPEIYWFMHVPVAWSNRSQIAISGDGKTATITIGSNRLQCRILAGTNATFSLMEAKPLPSSPVLAGQSANNGVTKLTVRYTGTTSERLAVWMVPLRSGQSAPTTAPTVTPLATWMPRTTRHAWAGDLDLAAAVSTADAQLASAAWAAQIASATGKATKPLDSTAADRVTPVTLSVPLNPGEQVTWAKLVAGVRATSDTTGGSDLLYVDSTTGTAYSNAAVGWGTLDTSPASRELVLSTSQLASLADGTLNVAFSPNTTVDWVELQYTTLDTTPPTATLTPSPAGTSTTPVGSVTIAFSEPVSGFDLADLALSRDGANVSLAGATLTTSDNRTFTLAGLSGVTSTAGGYTLALAATGSGIADASGNAIAAGATTTWQLSARSPTVALVPSAPGTTATPVASVAITFSAAVNGFAVGDLLLTRDGTAVPLAGATLTTSDDRQFVLGSLTGVTSTSGTYVLSLPAATAGITDKQGEAFTQSATATWTLDRVAPTAAIEVSAPGSSETPAETATITFSKPVTGFDVGDLVLTRNGGAVSLAAATLASTDGRIYTLDFGTATAVDGTYVLSLTGPGRGIVDGLGNGYASTASATWIYDTSVTVPAATTVVDATVRSGTERLVKRGAGTLVLTVAGTFTGGTVVEEGTLVVQSAAGLGGGGLEVRGGATVRIDVGYGTVALTSLALAATGRLDLGTGQVTVAAGGFDEATVRSQLVTGRNGGNWAGASGIGSLAAAQGSNRAVGYRVVSGALRLAWAALGDANLDGLVNSVDVSLINNARAFNRPLGTPVSWAAGDFNYSGTVNSIDMQLMNNTALFGRGSYRAAPVNVSYAQSSGWGSGFNGDVTIRNTGATTINGWTLEFDLDATITNIWNATIVSRVGTRYTITSASWNSSIGAGAEVSFGFQADGVAGETPRNRRFNGLAV
ncbi:MAG: PA14 domain-containing protein [Planctomycetota bacterium]